MRPGSALLSLAALCLAILASSSAGSAADITAQPAESLWDGLAETTFDHLDHRGGLIQDYVTALEQDSAGFLWIATEGGLARYDGYRFKPYRNDVDSDTSLPDNDVLCLHLDQGGQLWVGTQSGGLARYDAVNDRFVRYPSGPGRLNSNEITGIADDGGGGLWVGTWGGLNRLDPVTGTSRSFHHNGADPTSLPDDHIWSLRRDRAGDLWVGTGAGLVRLDRDGSSFVPVEAADAAVAKALRDSIKSLFQDEHGRIWVGTFRSGTVLIDPASGKSRLMPEPAGGLHGTQINVFAEIRPDVIWVGTDTSGIEAIDGETGHTKLIRHNPLVALSLVDDRVTAILRDRAGLVWVGTSSGLERHDPTTGAIVTIVGGPGHPDGISDPQVTAVAAAKSGLVWVGLEEQGAELLDPASHRVAALRPDPANVEHALPMGTVNALAMAPDDSVWIGTDHGLYLADPTGKTVSLVRLEALRPTPYVRSLYATADEVWIGTQDGLMRYRIARRDVRVYPADPDGTSGLSDARIMVIHPAGDGRYWIGTQHGLNLLDPESGDVERILPDSEDRSSLASSYVSTLAIDRAGRLWVGSAAAGIGILDHRDTAGHPVFRHIGTREGLPDATVDAFLLDSQGRIWASTDNRLALIDPATLTIHPMQAAEGVRFLSYWNQSAAATPHGDLLFGGAGGLTVVRPNLLRRQDLIPPIVVTDARIGDRALPVEPLSRETAAAALTLRPGDRGFQLEFAGLDLAAADREHYAYRLEGFDPDWVDAPQRVATYTNLPPGDYGLRLRVQGRDANWVERPRPVLVHVLPSWYQTVWFKLLAALLSLGLVAGFIQTRTASLRRRRAELEKLVEKRTAELVAANERLEALATTDGLTGVFNRRRFMELAVQELERTRRLGQPLCIVLSDLDNFKRINDSYGHLAGDAVLRVTAARFRAACRRIDTLARYGGEEFIILMPATDLDAAMAASERLRSSISSQPIPIEATELQVTVSIGIACWTGGLESLERLIDRADKALYAAKQGGRNRVELAPGPL